MPPLRRGVKGEKELEYALKNAKKGAGDLKAKEKSVLLHNILDGIAKKKKYCLKLRK